MERASGRVGHFEYERESAYTVPEENACVLVPSVAHTPPLLVVERR